MKYNICTTIYNRARREFIIILHRTGLICIWLHTVTCLWTRPGNKGKKISNSNMLKTPEIFSEFNWQAAPFFKGVKYLETTTLLVNMTSGEKKNHQQQKKPRICGFEVQPGKSQNRQVTKSNFVQSPKILTLTFYYKTQMSLSFSSYFGFSRLTAECWRMYPGTIVLVLEIVFPCVFK